MKKILLAVFAVAALMASCQKSNQEKADALVGEEMKRFCISLILTKLSKRSWIVLSHLWTIRRYTRKH